MLNAVTTHQPAAALEFRMIGGLEVRRDDVALELPPSKKTRALLAYLVLTQRQHRREALCQLLWDVTDDPRGALRWSLSKLRKQVDDGELKRICSDRERVGFEPHGTRVDVLEMRERLQMNDLGNTSTEELERWCERCTGEVLEGLDLPDFDTYQAWLVAEREHTRRLRAQVLAELVKRHQAEPSRALPHAMSWSQVDPMSGEARVAVMRTALLAGKLPEAKSHYQSARRLFSELDPQKERALTAAWHALRSEGPRTDPPSGTAAATSEARRSVPQGRVTMELSHKLATMLPLTGREEEKRVLDESLQEVARSDRARLLLVTGEPGIGKSRLLDELMLDARKAGHPVLSGAAYEGEAGRPYGPWIDALRKLPAHHLDGAARERLAPLLEARGSDEMGSREALFAGVVDVLKALVKRRAPVVVLEDVHWLDEGSAELLHYVVRMQRQNPSLFVLSARAAELSDSRSVLRVLRSLRRDVEQSDLPIGPLPVQATGELIARVNLELDAHTVHARSGGNPLYALELARSGTGELPREGTLADAVRERVERLSPEAGDVLRWCAVLGTAIAPEQLAALSSMEAEDQLLALEELERHALLRDEGRSYGFAHDVVRQVVYAGLSQPRRVLMHRRAAEALRQLQAEQRGAVDEAVVADIARHAALAEDHALAAAAYVAAGRRCLKLLAGENAAALARRGLRHARQLSDPDRARHMLELYDIQLWAERPVDPERFCEEVQSLSETALQHGDGDHARLGFNMQSYLRWERGDWNEARKKMLMAEEAVRGGEGEGRTEALAQAARCEALLERDMGLAESLLREGQAHAAQLGHAPASLTDAEALVRSFLGDVEGANRLFEQSRSTARAKRDRYLELQSMMSRFALLFDSGQLDDALELAGQTLELAEKTREGSERPHARMMLALTRLARGEQDALDALMESLEELRVEDAKHRLTYGLTRASRLLHARGDHPRALSLAREALDYARLLEWPSETVLALVAMARVLSDGGDEAALAEVEDALEQVETHKASAHARSVLSQWHAEE